MHQNHSSYRNDKVVEEESNMEVSEENVHESENNVEEINIFTGSQNRITFQQVYSKTFKCEYQLQLYPFDTQVIFKATMNYP